MEDGFKQRRRWWIVRGLIGLIVALGSVSFAYAHGPWHRGAQSADEMHARLERHVDRLLDEVDANDAQREQVEGIVDAAAPQMFVLAKEGRALREQVKHALLSNPVDRERLAETKQKLDDLAGRLSGAVLDNLASVAEVLTPQQRRLIADKLARFQP
jgi:Spy/CpxP family protein refolding chaperone